MNRLPLGGVLLSLGLLVGVGPACSKREEAPARNAAPKEPTADPAAPKPAAAPSRLAELANVAASSFSVEKLESIVSSLSTEELQFVAGRLVESIAAQDAAIVAAQQRFSTMSPTDLGGLSDMKRTIESSERFRHELRGKLTVAVDALKAKGVDVSRYSEFLTGK